MSFYNRPLIAVTIGLIIAISKCPVAQAQPYKRVGLSGVTWRIPSQFVSGQSSPSAGFKSVSLSFELPSFSPVNPAQFAGVNPNEDRPILTATISDDPKVDTGPHLLNTYISEALITCPTCTVDPSSLGGKEYASFDAIGGPPALTIKDGLFRLYEYPSSGGQFVICRFSPNLVTLPCEMIERLNAQLTVKIDFPIEYLSQGLDLVKALNSRLATYPAGASKHLLPMAFPPPLICWEPAPGSLGAEMIPLNFGPEVWHIPRAFGETFGQNQTQDSRYNSFNIWLKLPDLEPLTAADPSPIVIAGPGKYISISIEYNDRNWISETRDAFLKRYLMGMHRITTNAFFPFGEFQPVDTGSLSELYMEQAPTSFIADNLNYTDMSFPPNSFTCYQYGGAPSPGCTLDVVAPTKEIKPNEYAATYDVSYDFSRDYFSQMTAISACVQKLYETFRFGGTGT